MLLLRYFLEQPLSLASMSALAVTYITAWCVPITQNGDCGHRQDKALCGKRCTSAIKRKHRIARPHPTTPHSRHPSVVQIGVGGEFKSEPARLLHLCRSNPRISPHPHQESWRWRLYFEGEGVWGFHPPGLR